MKLSVGSVHGTENFEIYVFCLIIIKIRFHVLASVFIYYKPKETTVSSIIGQTCWTIISIIGRRPLSMLTRVHSYRIDGFLVVIPRARKEAFIFLNKLVKFGNSTAVCT